MILCAFKKMYFAYIGFQLVLSKQIPVFFSTKYTDN